MGIFPRAVSKGEAHQELWRHWARVEPTANYASIRENEELVKAEIDRLAAKSFVTRYSDWDAVLKRFGTVHVLVNSAGVIGKFTLQNMSEAEMDRVLDINLKGTMLCTQAVIAPMRAQGGGAVVNVASMAAKRVSYAGAANYTASKAGVLGFTWHAAFELGAYKIRVNAVCPGPTLTGMSSKRNAEQRAETAARIPLGRWVTPEDVSNAILFLASDEAAMCTGTSLDVDGGILVSNGSSYDEYFSVRT